MPSLAARLLIDCAVRLEDRLKELPPPTDLQTRTIITLLVRVWNYQRNWYDTSIKSAALYHKPLMTPDEELALDDIYWRIAVLCSRVDTLIRTNTHSKAHANLETKSGRYIASTLYLLMYSIAPSLLEMCQNVAEPKRGLAEEYVAWLKKPHITQGDFLLFDWPTAAEAIALSIRADLCNIFMIILAIPEKQDDDSP